MKHAESIAPTDGPSRSPRGAGIGRPCDPNWNIALPALVADGDTRSAQLMRAIVAHIETHQIPAGVRLPSSRQLAAAMGVGRNTAMLAIDSLVEQGWLVVKDRSGVVVAHDSQRRPARRPAHGAGARPHGPAWFGHAQAVDVPSANDAVAADAASLCSFVYGQFDATLFPLAHWRECERAASGPLQISRWARDVVDEDDPALVEQLRMNVLPAHGIWARPEELLVTMGGQEGRYLVSQLLCRSGTRVGIENPGMSDMRRIVELTGGTCVPLRVDADGLDPSSGFDGCDVVFTTAAHQCPTSATMPRARRLELLERSRRHRTILVEDSYETEGLGQGGLDSSLRSMDAHGEVINISSLSKLLAPGLRMGVIVAKAGVIELLRDVRRLIHRHPPGNTQRALAVFIERGYYRTYLRRVVRELDQRALVFEREMARCLPDFRWQHQKGTSGFWVEMPSHIDGDTFCAAARKAGVLIESGSRFFAASPGPSHFLRMGLSTANERTIAQGLAVLGKVRAGF